MNTALISCVLLQESMTIALTHFSSEEKEVPSWCGGGGKKQEERALFIECSAECSLGDLVMKAAQTEGAFRYC